jgi:hypothetical protein
MISISSILALATADDEECQSNVVVVGRNRRDWVRGDVRCLMCARLVGRLLGSDDRRHSTTGTVTFFAYRSVGADRPVVTYWPGMRLGCAVCGGAGALDDVELFSTYDEAPTAFDSDDQPVRRGPGRPPRCFKPVGPSPAPETMLRDPRVPAASSLRPTAK